MSQDTQTKPETKHYVTRVETKITAKIADAIKAYASTFAGFAQSVDTLDTAKSEYTAKAQAYEAAKKSAVDALCKAMRAAGFKQEGFDTADNKRLFIAEWNKALNRPYTASTQARLWQELCNAATNSTGQKFGVHNPSSVAKAKQRDQLAKVQDQKLKALGVNEHTAPINLRQKAAELAISSPADASILITEALNREAKQKKAEQDAQQTVIKNKREMLRKMVAHATLEQLDALLATAKTIKLTVKDDTK